MTAFQIVVERRTKHSLFPFPSLRGHKAIVDLLVSGTNLTARLGDAEVVPLLRDLALAIADLSAGRRTRASISCLGGDEPWQLGVERAGKDALLSLFRAGNAPEVAVHERRIAGHDLREGTLLAIEKTREEVAPEEAAELLLSREALVRSRWPEQEAPRLATVEVSADEDEASLRFSTRMTLRRNDEHDEDDAVERSDLLGLLVRGPLRLEVGDHERELGEVFVFLVAERLLDLSEGLLDAFEQSRAFYRRTTVSGVGVGVRYEPSAEDAPKPPTIWLSMGSSHDGGAGRGSHFPAVELAAFIEAAVAFAEGLEGALLRNDPSHRYNLRLSSMRRAARELRERLRETTRDDAKVNPAPESYRAFATLAQRAEPKPRSRPSPARIRFVPRWTAEVPGIDLRATFLCGDRLIVGAARETACLDRATGAVLWREPTSRAVSVVTPAGLARIAPDGLLSLHDFGTGEVTRSLKLSPRVGGTTSGATVNAPGLPRLLVVTEGERHLSAIDLASFEVRFRHTGKTRGSFRIRRAGRLLIVASSDPTLFAIDVATGDVVWRVRDRLPFSTQAALDRDSLFTLSGEVDRPGGRLHHLDPYAGTSHWVRELPASASPSGTVLLARDIVAVVTRDRRGQGVLAFDRASGDLRWELPPGFASTSCAWLVVDDLLVANDREGVLSALDVDRGALHFRHTLRTEADVDEPMRLEPILRAGALFVPQSAVHVIRPRDGEPLGTLPCELVPDLLRIDEECAAYVAEESGHLAAFEAGARLTLVKG